jgi:hypothetical protein
MLLLSTIHQLIWSLVEEGGNGCWENVWVLTCIWFWFFLNLEKNKIKIILFIQSNMEHIISGYCFVHLSVVSDLGLIYKHVCDKQFRFQVGKTHELIGRLTYYRVYTLSEIKHFWISNVICHDVFLSSMSSRWEVIVRLCWYWLNSWPSLFILPLLDCSEFGKFIITLIHNLFIISFLTECLCRMIIFQWVLVHLTLV